MTTAKSSRSSSSSSSSSSESKRRSTNPAKDVDEEGNVVDSMSEVSEGVEDVIWKQAEATAHNV